MEDLFVAKVYMLIFIVKTQWLKCLVMHQNPQVVFPIGHPFIGGQDHGKYVMPTLDSCVTTIVYFDLWMSKFGHNTFTLVINFINSKWVPYNVTLGLFEAINTIKVAMVTQVKDLLSSYDLLNKLVAYVKYEGDNLSILA
jgi:hypothetical protein